MKKVTKYRGYSSFGKLVKKGLVDKDMTAVELASILGIKPQYLNSILHGERSGKKYKSRIRKILGLEMAA